MKLLFLYPYPLYQAPSQRFRFEQYLTVLKSHGVTCICQSFWDNKTWNVLYYRSHYFIKMTGILKGFFRRLSIVLRYRKVDIVFIHRECLPIGPPLIEWIIARVLKKKIIYDFDDAIWLPNTSNENALASFLKQHGKVKSICRLSFKISCGNLYLKEFAEKFNPFAIVNPTTIDTTHLHNPARYNVQKRQDIITIGWTGSHSTLKYLNILLPVFKKLESKFPNQWRLLIIADKPPDLNLGSIEFKQWSKETEIEDLLQLDIGIMPLPDDEWAKGKCGFKALQYLALEIPALVSSVGVNKSIVDHGINGYLCTTENEWLYYLEELLFDESLRKNMGRDGRKKIISNYSVLSNSSNFLDLLSL